MPKSLLIFLKLWINDEFQTNVGIISKNICELSVKTYILTRCVNKKYVIFDFVINILSLLAQ